MGTSAGGKRPKLIVGINEKTKEVKSGQVDLPEGFTHYILKFDDDSSYPYAKLEYISYLMAKEAGITMMPSMLKSFGKVSHFLTKRFDRVGNEKIHMQTLAAMSPLTTTYDGVFEVIRKLNLSYTEVEQHYLRMVFNVMAKNVEDHTKNFSFLMDREGHWQLSPAYDLTFSVDLSGYEFYNRHSLLINGKDEGIELSDLLQVAKKNGIKNPMALIEQVREAISQFPRLAKELGISKSLMEKITDRFILLTN